MSEHDVLKLLDEAKDLFTDRNAEYGNAYIEFGEKFFNFWGESVTLKDGEDFGRFTQLLNLYRKLDRYRRNFAKGGHADSMRDLAVEAKLLEHFDKLNSKRKSETEKAPSLWQNGANMQHYLQQKQEYEKNNPT
jgi:hypothetical protein